MKTPFRMMAVSRSIRAAGALAVAVLAVAVFASCELFARDVPAKTALVKDNAAASFRRLSSETGSAAHDSDARTTISGATTGAPVAQITPTNVAGEVITVSIMVGDQNGSALFLITPSEEGFADPSVNSTDASLSSFDLSDPVRIAAEISLGGDYPSDDQAIAARIELLFAWVDVTIAASDTGLAGEQKVRVVYADVDDLDYQRGDLLLWDAGAEAWEWADSVSSNLTPTRPDAPIHLADVAAYAGTEDGRGNQYIPVFVANIPESERIALQRSELLANSWEFDVVFDLTNGVELSVGNPQTEIATDYALLNAFSLNADVGTGELGFTAWLDARPTPR